MTITHMCMQRGTHSVTIPHIHIKCTGTSCDMPVYSSANFTCNSQSLCGDIHLCSLFLCICSGGWVGEHPWHGVSQEGPHIVSLVELQKRVVFCSINIHVLELRPLWLSWLQPVDSSQQADYYISCHWGTSFFEKKQKTKQNKRKQKALYSQMPQIYSLAGFLIVLKEHV